MKEKPKKVFWAILIIVIVVLINLFLLFVGLKQRLGFQSMEKEHLEETFIGLFQAQDYPEISSAESESGNTIVYYGKSGGLEQYTLFQRIPLLDIWISLDRSYVHTPECMEYPFIGKVFISSGTGYDKAIITEDGKTREIDLDPEQSLIAITGTLDGEVSFHTVGGSIITEEALLGTAYP